MRKLTFLFALLCASMMSFAIDWSGYEWLGNGGVDGKYNNKIKVAVSPTLPSGSFINNMQTSNSHPAIHIAMPSDLMTVSLDASAYTKSGAAIFPYLDVLTKQETEFMVECQGTTYTFTIYYADGEPDDLTGWNIARGKTAVAGKDAGGAFVPSSANDTKTNTRWASGSSAKHYAAVGNAAEDWWYVDLGDYYRVDLIKILFERANPSDYDLLISNNAVSWTVLGSFTTESKFGDDPATDYNEYDFSSNPKVGRYVKIFVRAGYENLAYGVSMWEFEVYGDHGTLADVNPPTMTSASLAEGTTHNQVNITVAGTDTEDGVVTQFHVVDASKGVDQACIAVAGVIAVTGLSETTSYSFTITALDAAGNESANSVVVAATTTADLTTPQTAAPTPSGTNKEIRPIYSDAFASILEHGFDKDGFAGMPVFMEKNFSGDNCLVYDRSGAAQTFTTWGMYDDGANAIIAQSAYRAAGKMGVDASGMENLHIDIWSLQACNTILIRINDGGRTGDLRLSHDGSGWKSYDIPLSEFETGANVDNVRWFKFEAFDAITGKVAIDNVYFWKTASGLSSVSATPNDATMGTATVKQNNVAVTEVTTGTEVTFSAVANEGYVFVNWSNGNTNASFTTEVNASMNLTANFRALNHISCNEEMISGDYTAYVTYKKTANENEYSLIVRSAQTMINFTNAYVGHINGNDQINMSGQGTLSANGHMLSYTFTSTTEPKLNTPLYVNFANHGEVTFNQINNGTVFEFAVPCSDPEITAIELNKTEATLDMGNTLTLIPSFTPAYMSADVTWLTSDESKATASDGVVTPVAPGNVTVTAKISESVKATCAITIQAAASHNYFGYGTDQGLDYTYRIEYTTDHHIVAHVKRQGNKTGLVDVGMNINNVWTTINVTEGEDVGWKKGTTEATFTAGDEITIILQSNFAGASSIINIPYTVGADNVMPTIVPSTLTLNYDNLNMAVGDAGIQLTAEIHHCDAANKTITWLSDDETVATVVNGLVTPVGAGTTTIHATTFNNIPATCDVTVVGALTAATWHGSASFTVKGNKVGVNYSVTRNTDHTLTYRTSLSEAVPGMVMQVNDGDWHNLTQDANARNAEWTSTATYVDGTSFSFFFYPGFAGGADRWDVHNYEVGSSNAEPNTLVALNDGVDGDGNNNNSTKLTEFDGEVVDVLVTRTFPQTSEWYTLCLPFDMSEAQMTATFGAGYTLSTLTGAEDRGSLIHLNFDYVRALEAGKPYMVRPGSAVNAAPTISGVTIQNIEPIQVGDAIMKFVGTFSQITLNSANQLFVGPENYLYSPAEGGTVMNAFRCFFNIPSGSPALTSGKRACIVFAPETTTNVEAIQNDKGSCTKVIMNGQLFIIRDNRMYNAQGALVK